MSQTATAETTTSTERDHRWAALIVLCTGMLMIVLDQTIVNVALPSIQKDLEFTQSGLSWVVNAYLVAFGGCLLLAGRIGDIIGRRKMFLMGLVVFVIASMLCGVATSQAMLIVTRLLQGIGGAMTSAVVLGMIVTTFSEPNEQAKALGVFTFVATAGASIGLLAGGIITEGINWHWIFFVNVPVGVIVAISARRLVHDEEGIGWGDGADVIGAALVTSGLMLAVYAIIKAADYGWLSSHTLGLGVVALFLIVAFLFRESRVQNPLLPLRIFKSRNITVGNTVQVLTVVGMFGMFFLGSLYFQRILGYTALQVGTAFLPISILMGLESLFVTPRLVKRFGMRRAMLSGFSIQLLGLVLFARVPVDANYVNDLMLGLALIGIGAGLAFPVLTGFAMSDSDASDSGLVSGLFNTAAQLGGALGLAVLATLSSSRTASQLAKGVTQDAALASGYRLAFAVGASLTLLAICLAWLYLGRGRVEPELPEHEIVL